MGEDALWVLQDAPQFMLALLSMTNAEYQLWRAGIPYAKRLMDEMGYDEFSETRLMSFLIHKVCIIFYPFPFILLSCTFAHNDTC